MKLNLKPFYIVIISEKVLNIVGYMSGVGNTAKGAAFFPFMMVRSKEYMQPWLINHELIHFRQQIETLIIGSIILNFCEKMYGMFVLRKTQKESYLWISAEQEAYLNQDDPQYLKTRPLWSQFKYIVHKKKISVPSPGKVVVE